MPVRCAGRGEADDSHLARTVEAVLARAESLAQQLEHAASAQGSALKQEAAQLWEALDAAVTHAHDRSGGQTPPSFASIQAAWVERGLCDRQRESAAELGHLKSFCECANALEASNLKPRWTQRKKKWGFVLFLHVQNSHFCDYPITQLHFAFGKCDSFLGAWQTAPRPHCHYTAKPHCEVKEVPQGGPLRGP